MKFIKQLSIIAIIIMFKLDASASLKEVITAYNKGNLAAALNYSRHHNLKDVHNFLLSQKYLDKTDKSSFEEITDFLKNNPMFP